MEDAVRIVLLTLPQEPGGAVFSRLYALLPQEGQERVLSYRREKDRTLALCAEVLLRKEITCKTGLKSAEIHIIADEGGKPRLAKGDIHFNISHTQDAVALALADSEVGVDVERIRSVNLRVAERFFAPDECEYVFQPLEGTEGRFFEMWTRKEAYLKKLGTGLRTPLSSFSVLNGRMGLHTYVCEDIILSVCASPAARIQLDIYTLEEFLQTIPQ